MGKAKRTYIALLAAVLLLAGCSGTAGGPMPFYNETVQHFELKRMNMAIYYGGTLYPKYEVIQGGLTYVGNGASCSYTAYNRVDGSNVLTQTVGYPAYVSPYYQQVFNSNELALHPQDFQPGQDLPELQQEVKYMVTVGISDTQAEDGRALLDEIRKRYNSGYAELFLWYKFAFNDSENVLGVEDKLLQNCISPSQRAVDIFYYLHENYEYALTDITPYNYDLAAALLETEGVYVDGLLLCGQGMVLERYMDDLRSVGFDALLLQVLVSK